MQACLDNRSFDKIQISQRFNEASATYDSVANIQRKCATQLVEFALQNTLNTGINSVLDVGCGTGFATKVVHEYLLCHPSSTKRIYTLNDISSNMLDSAKFNLKNLCANCTNFQLGDMEQLEFGNHDLVISNFALQWASNLNYMINKLYKSSNKILAFSMLLDGTFAEWYKICDDNNTSKTSGDLIKTYPDSTQVLGYIQNCNPIKYQYNIEEFEISFENMKAFLSYVKQLGASYNITNIRFKTLKKILKSNSEANNVSLTTKYKVFFGILIK